AKHTETGLDRFTGGLPCWGGGQVVEGQSIAGAYGHIRQDARGADGSSSMEITPVLAAPPPTEMRVDTLLRDVPREELDGCSRMVLERHPRHHNGRGAEMFCHPAHAC